MHIIITVLTALAGLIWAIYRLQNSGLDINSFNPFYWARRRRWEKQLGTKAIHRLESSMEAAALLVLATARLDGEVTRECKAEVLRLFVEEFGADEPMAMDLYTSSSYLLRDEPNVAAEAKNILAPHKESLAPNQVESLMKMLNVVANCEGMANSDQKELIQAVETFLSATNQSQPQW